MDKEYNRIVLIGNGFDRALGLKTSYLDFILNYLKRATIEKLRNQSNIYDLITFKNMSIQMSQNIDSYIIKLNNIETVREYLELLNRKVEIQYKYDFFDDIVNQYGDARWVDIEQHYYAMLKRGFSTIKSNPHSNDDLSNIISLNKCMDELTTALSTFIKEQQKTISLSDPLYNLLVQIVEPLRDKIPSLVKRHNRQHAPTGVLFLDFNYTNTVSQIIDNSFINGDNRHLYIHGTVNYEENPIIFGYGDDTGEEYKELESEGENELLRKIKSFQYPRTHNYHNLLNYLELGDYDIFVIGHSCGLSDRTLLKTIFEHENCLAIQNFHYKGESEDFEKRMEISRHFSNKVLMRERLLPFNNLATIPQCKI